MLKKTSFNLLLPLMLLLVSSAVCAEQGSENWSFLTYNFTPKVIYGKGVITKDGKQISRNLWMDVYRPAKEGKRARPAVIMTFGGAFHRGNPRNTFEVDGAQDTSMGNYCRRFAERGYVCFAIDYRLGGENPVLTLSGYAEDEIDKKSFNLLFPQMNKVRGMLGMNALDREKTEDFKFVRDVVLCAAEDLQKAVAYVRRTAKKYNVDADRIVLGGFSAGAVTSWNVTYGLKAPVVGCFLMSGGNVGFDITKSLQADSPPSLIFFGENDLEEAHLGMKHMLQSYEKAGARHSFAWVPGFGHFYPAGAPSLSCDGSKMSVEKRILRFLEQTTSWTKAK